MPGCISAGPKSVARAMGAASLRSSAIASADQPPLPRCKIKRYCASLSGAISSTRALPFLPVNCNLILFLIN